MIAALITIPCVIGYLVIVGAWGAAFYRSRLSVCKYCSAGRRCPYDHVGAGFFVGVFWPLTIPASIGVLLGSREDRRRDEELAAAKHRADIAEEQAREDAALDRRLRSLNRDAA